MAKWLIAILGVFVLQIHAAPLTTDDWVDVKVPSRLLHHFINDKTCLSNPEYLASCKRALQRAAELAGVQIADSRHIDFEKEFRILEKKSAEKINLNELRLEAIKAQAQYFDPHADFEPIAADRAERSGSRQFAGLGIYPEIYNQQARIKSVMPGSPAEASGLMAGDILLSADLPNGRLNLTQTAASAIAQLKAPAGTSAPLEIVRDGRTLKIDARFDSFPISPILSRMEGSTAYIRITSFVPDDLCKRFENALQTAIDAGAKNLIVDLRANTGGQVPNAICAASRLLGPKIVLGEKRIQPLSPTLAAIFNDDDDEISSDEPIRWIRGGHEAITNMPVVILMDNLTASASEIFAGAMQDHARAWLVGTRTFGKAVMQENQPIRQMDTQGVWGGRTTTLLYQPSGRSIQRTGLTPDFTEPTQYGDDINAYIETREIDMNPRTLKVESAPWVQPRASEISQLKKCTEGSEGRALKIYHRLVDARRADYQLAYGLSILDCEK